LLDIDGATDLEMLRDEIYCFKLLLLGGLSIATENLEA
jgi:hypothetical protein